MQKLPFSPEEFRAIYSKVPRLTVDLIIRLNDGIVLTYRTLPTWTGQWHWPGGTVYYEETIDEAAERVALAEVNLRIKIRETLGYLSYPSEQRERGFGNSIGVVLLCDALSNDLKAMEQANKAQVFKDLPDNMIGEQKKFAGDNLAKIMK